MAQPAGSDFVLYLMRVVISIPLAGLLSAGDCWALASIASRATDYVCGHNIYPQWPVAWFIVFLLLRYTPT